MKKNEAIELVKEGHIVEAMMTVAMFFGAKRINALPGLWEKKIDESWTIKCNGHQHVVAGIMPLTWYVEYNGWPAGSLSIFGEGALCAGEGANEETLRAALIECIETSETVTA